MKLKLCEQRVINVSKRQSYIRLALIQVFHVGTETTA